LEQKDESKFEVKTVVEEKKDEFKKVAPTTRLCFNCGQAYNNQHRRFCPALKVKCHVCLKVGHFAKFCKSSSAKEEIDKKKEFNSNDKKVHNVNWSEEGKYLYINLDKSDNARKVDSLNDYHLNRLGISCIRWKKRFVINDMPIEFKIDTGSDANCVPVGFLKKINVPISKHVDCNVVDYSSNKIKTYGRVDLTCFDMDRQLNYTTNFLVVDDSYEPILGLESSVAFGLVKRINQIKSLYPTESLRFLESNSDVFDGLGRIPGKCSIVLKQEFAILECNTK
jgi:hypothetical protein